MSFLLIFALQCFFPIFDMSPGEWVGLSVVNPDTQTREVTVTATSSDGNITQTGHLSLASGAQRARLLGEILQAPLLFQSGWLRIDFGLPACSAYMATGTDQALAGTDATTATGTTVIIPHVSVNTGFLELNHTDTLVAVVNPNSNSATVTAQLFSVDGVPSGGVLVDIPIRGSKTLRVSETFRDMLPDNHLGGKVFEGYLRISSNAAIAAWQRIDTPLTRSMLRGRTPAGVAPTTQVLVPHFIFDGTYRSILNLLNPEDTPVSLEMTAIGDSGETIGEIVRLTLQPGECIRGSIGGIFRVVLPAVFPPPKVEGHIRIRQSQGGTFRVLGDMAIATDASSIMYPLEATIASGWTLPFAASSSPWITAYVIANPNELLTVQTDVQVEELNDDGKVVRRSSLSLSPRSRRVGVVLSRLNTGYLRLSGNLPIIVMGSIGTEDGRHIDQIPLVPMTTP